MTADTWNPSQYDRYRNERSQPFFDLLALVRARPSMRVVDLGCGTGALTRAMHERLGATETLGLDASDAMLTKCKEHAGGGLSFAKGDIAAQADTWAQEPPTPPFDLVFSNAAIHWVDHHRELLGKLARALGPKGQLAVQVPANEDQPPFVVARALAAEPPFAEALAGYEGRADVLAPEAYARILHEHRFAEQHVRLQVYAHELAGREDVVEWVKGSLLTDYEKRMPAALFAIFLARFRERLLPQLEDTHPHLYPFKRILFWGERP